MTDTYDCECPVCGASPNFSCVTGRNEMRAQAHEERILAAAVLGRDHLSAELERKNTRIEELLAVIVRVTNETPFSDEAKDALEQRGKLLAEIGTLRSDLESARRDADRLAARVTELEQDRAYERRISAEMSAERERIRSLLAEACDSLETEGLDETAARLRQQGGAWER